MSVTTCTSIHPQTVERTLYLLQDRPYRTTFCHPPKRKMPLACGVVHLHRSQHQFSFRPPNLTNASTCATEPTETVSDAKRGKSRKSSPQTHFFSSPTTYDVPPRCQIEFVAIPIFPVPRGVRGERERERASRKLWRRKSGTCEQLSAYRSR